MAETLGNHLFSILIDIDNIVLEYYDITLVIDDSLVNINKIKSIKNI
ncbi:hypothetical protein AN1V17_20700 [Vallitalea sediminicola]